MPTSRYVSSRVQVGDAESTSTFLYTGANEVIYEISEASWPSIIWGWTKNAAFLVLVTFALLVCVYFFSAATVVYVAPISGGHAVIARGTFVGGVATEGTQVYGSMTTQVDENFASSLRSGFGGVPAPFVGRVLTNTNYATVAVRGGDVYVDGNYVAGTLVNPTETTNLLDPVYFSTTDAVLKNQWVIRCEMGTCKPGDLYIIPAQQVSGEVHQWL